MRLVARVALLSSLLGFHPGVAVETASAQEYVAASPVTVRLWATREGLVGRPTAAGHLITANDHFVALPSRKALNKTVIVSYGGKNQTAPVLDIGPWNRDDAWWEVGAARGAFQDLPRWLPEVWAAFENGYNGGHDANGRFVTFPAMIDLAEGVRMLTQIVDSDLEQLSVGAPVEVVVYGLTLADVKILTAPVG